MVSSIVRLAENRYYYYKVPYLRFCRTAGYASDSTDLQRNTAACNFTIKRTLSRVFSSEFPGIFQSK